MNYFKKRYLRFWKSFAKRTKSTFLFNHYYHGKLLLDASEPTSREIYAGYEYDFDVFKFIEEITKQDNISVFLDVGSNWGAYSLCAARCGIPRVEAFEPNRKVFGLLAANVTLNGFYPQVRVWSLAAGSENKEGQLFVDPRATDVSTLSPDAMDGRWNYSQSQNCTIRRLDDLLALEGETIFVKVDVEGHEIDAFSGMSNILSQNKTRLLVEILDSEEQVKHTLDKLGFTKKQRFGNNHYYENF